MGRVREVGRAPDAGQPGGAAQSRDEVEGALDALVREALRSAGYRAVSPDLARRIGEQELARRRTLKEAVKATRSRLHQVYGAFFPAAPRYDAWLEELRAALAAGEPARDMVSGDARARRAHAGDDGPEAATAERALPWQRPAFRDACRRIMARHASTAERLAILPGFYGATLDELPPIRSVLDLGCGLNPLAIPWMGLPANVAYTCCDVDAALIAFLNRFFALAGIDGRAELRDVVSAPPQDRADLALALKLLPTLDQIERDAGAALLRTVRAPAVLVSFPARSLGGREKGMARHYEARFLALAEAEGWAVRRVGFATELAFLVRKSE